MAIFWPPPQSMPIRDSIFMQLFKTRLCVLDSAFCLEHCVLCPFFQSSRRQSTRKHFALYSNSNISAVVTLACIAQKIKHQRVGPLDGDCARLLLFKAFLGERPTRNFIQHRGQILKTQQIGFQGLPAFNPHSVHLRRRMPSPTHTRMLSLSPNVGVFGRNLLFWLAFMYSLNDQGHLARNTELLSSVYFGQDWF